MNFKKIFISLLGLAGISFLFHAAKNYKSEDELFDDRIKNATDSELSDLYEQLRQPWIKNGGGDKTPEMQKIDMEMNRRAGERQANNPYRNTDPNYRWTDANRWDRD